jgi:hypothetical protein
VLTAGTKQNSGLNAPNTSGVPTFTTGTICGYKKRKPEMYKAKHSRYIIPVEDTEIKGINFQVLNLNCL